LQQYNAKFAENYVINNDCDVKKSTKTAKLVQKKCKNAIRCKKFVLQPVQNATELRLWLLENNYKIIKDYCFEDKGKFYFVFVVDGYGKNKYSKNDKIFGKTNLKNKTSDFILYLKDQQKKLKFLENFDKLNITKTSEKEIKQKLKYYKKTEKIIKGSKIYDSRNN
jgi:tRNA (adenine22-N1)-methyltransferase